MFDDDERHEAGHDGQDLRDAQGDGDHVGEPDVEAGDGVDELPSIGGSGQTDPGEVDGDDAKSDALRERLGELREEADRIGGLGTGPEQVEAAERFAEDAGRLDEQLGAAARDADDDRSS